MKREKLDELRREPEGLPLRYELIATLEEQHENLVELAGRVNALEARRGKENLARQPDGLTRPAQDGQGLPVAGSSPASPASPPAFRVGDRVRNRSDGQRGEIVRKLNDPELGDLVDVRWDDGMLSQEPCGGASMINLTRAPAASDRLIEELREQRDAALRDLEARTRERDEARKQRLEALRALNQRACGNTSCDHPCGDAERALNRLATKDEIHEFENEELR